MPSPPDTVVQSRPKGVGSRIRSGFPVGDDASVTSVLIVDDHPSFRATARVLLEAEGYDVVGEAEDGGTALTRVRELHPEIVLLDVQLPDLDGFEVASRLTGDGNTHPRVVLVSSRDRADYGSKIEESGAAGFIAKAELCGPALAALLG
jgi:DNA-binding NarL/FixJ family response regulator